MADPPAGALPTGDRLQKVMARIGVGSRRVCEDLIVDGRVTVNGAVPVLGRRVDPAVDRVELDGVPLPVRPGLVHYLVNKPAGVVSTAEDTHGRRTVVDLVPGDPRVFPVGRLDMDSEGLVILTNDGELTHRLTHPSFGVAKEYLVQVDGEPTSGAVRQLRQGVELDDGPTAPARVAVVSPSLLRIVIHEGRNRQVRRMCEAVGHPVLRLVRTRIGPLADPSLGPGSYRVLTFDEVRGLAAATTSAESGDSPAAPLVSGRSVGPPDGAD
ncbi:MAG TPA: pseudouridine synthase [Acidimicrobiales bacterium]|nr:pseudouridine synthase [Acidimicrobiales bacterium]